MEHNYIHMYYLYILCSTYVVTAYVHDWHLNLYFSLNASERYINFSIWIILSHIVLSILSFFVEKQAKIDILD